MKSRCKKSSAAAVIQSLDFKLNAKETQTSSPPSSTFTLKIADLVISFLFLFFHLRSLFWVLRTKTKYFTAWVGGGGRQLGWRKDEGIFLLVISSPLFKWLEVRWMNSSLLSRWKDEKEERVPWHMNSRCLEPPFLSCALRPPVHVSLLGVKVKGWWDEEEEGREQPVVLPAHETLLFIKWNSSRIWTTNKKSFLKFQGYRWWIIHGPQSFPFS